MTIETVIAASFEVVASEPASLRAETVGLTLEEWKLEQTEWAALSGAAAAAVPFAAIFAIAGDLTILMNRMHATACGVGSIIGRDELGSDIVDADDYRLVLARWAGGLDLSQLTPELAAQTVATACVALAREGRAEALDGLLGDGEVLSNDDRVLLASAVGGKIAADLVTKVGVKLASKLATKAAVVTSGLFIGKKAGGKLAVALTKKAMTKLGAKASAAVPIIGIAASAGINAWFIHSIFDAAHEYYRWKVEVLRRLGAGHRAESSWFSARVLLLVSALSAVAGGGWYATRDDCLDRRLAEACVANAPRAAEQGFLSRAEAYRRVACEEGSAQICWSAARQEPTSSQAVRSSLIRVACEKGAAEACASIARELGPNSSPDDARLARPVLEAACNAGEKEDCRKLGAMLIAPEWKFLDPVGGAQVLERLCGEHDWMACALWGNWLAQSNLKEDQARGISTLQKACSANHAASCFLLGAARKQQANSAQELSVAVKALSRSCELGDPRGCMGKAQYYLERREAVPAMKALEAGCALHDEDSCRFASELAR